MFSVTSGFDRIMGWCKKVLVLVLVVLVTGCYVYPRSCLGETIPVIPPESGSYFYKELGAIKLGVMEIWPLSKHFKRVYPDGGHGVDLELEWGQGVMRIGGVPIKYTLASNVSYLWFNGTPVIEKGTYLYNQRCLMEMISWWWDFEEPDVQGKCSLSMTIIDPIGLHLRMGGNFRVTLNMGVGLSRVTEEGIVMRAVDWWDNSQSDRGFATDAVVGCEFVGELFTHLEFGFGILARRSRGFSCHISDAYFLPGFIADCWGAGAHIGYDF